MMDQSTTVFYYCGNNTNFEGKKVGNQRDGALLTLKRTFTKMIFNIDRIWYNLMEFSNTY